MVGMVSKELMIKTEIVDFKDLVTRYPPSDLA